jgi:tetratricopeptide (TPR) repeat protein
MNRLVGILILLGLVTTLTETLPDAATAASKAPHKAKENLTTHKTAIDAALRYAGAIATGDRITTGQLDFSCQYRLVATRSASPKNPPTTDPFYDACWQSLTAGHAPLLQRSDIGLNILWPSTGPLVFYGDELSRTQASAFVMDALGMSPPGTGLHLTVTNSRAIPNGSFRLKRNGNVIGVPSTVVDLTAHYHDPLTAPVTYGPTTAQWTSTVKRERRVLKSITTRWVVFTGLRKHGFPHDTAVFHHPVESKPDAPGMIADRIPFATETSHALPESMVWWGPEDQPGTLTAAAARAATFPELRDRVALLNRILIIDPNQVDALTVLTKALHETLLQEAAQHHKLIVKDPALSLTVNEFYWNTYAAGRLDLSNAMEMGGRSQPTPADFLYRLLPASEALARTHPEQLDNRFRLGMAYRWNNDQDHMIETFESLVNDIPTDRLTPKAEALIQSAWSRINKVSWNRVLHDPDSVRAYDDAKSALAIAELPLDKFLAEYTMAYSMIFMPNYGDKKEILNHLTEAKRWFNEVPGKDDQVWRYFLHSELLKAVLDADPRFQPILAAEEKPKG